MSEHEKSPDELEPGKISQKLVRVHDVPDEGTAAILVDFLRGEGIHATAQPVEISMLPGVESMSHGYWGHVEVLGRDAARARALIRDYLNAPAEPSTPRTSRDDRDPEDAA